MRMFKYFYRHKGLLALAAVVLFISVPSAKAGFLTEEQQSIDTALKLNKSIVKVEPALMDHGSGFYVSPNLIVTNWHVVKSGEVSQISHKFTKPGEYLILCNEYCGTGHEYMNTVIVVK